MKNIIKNTVKGLVPLLICFFVAISCNNDDEMVAGNFDLATLQDFIDRAEGLIANSEEGIRPGNYQPGSKQSLQDVVNWINNRITTSKSQGDIDDAVLKIRAAIDSFLGSIVAPAFAYVQQTPGSYIETSLNLKEVFKNPFTIETQIYVVDLNQLGFSNNAFTMTEEPQRGFNVRYFNDGSIQSVIGIEGAWPETPRDDQSTKMVANAWVSLAMSYDGAEQKLYVNGELVYSQNAVMAFPPVTPFVLGNSFSFNDRVCNALFKELRIWDKVLSASEVQSNLSATFEGTEANLEAYFPMVSDLGDSFSDVSGEYTAKFVGDTKWVPELPELELDFVGIDAAIKAITDFKASVTEGTQDGDYPIGTLSYIDTLITNANEIKENETRQAVINDEAEDLNGKIALINANLVAPSPEGIFADETDPTHDGFRITPNYTPQGDYTYELDFNLADLLVTSNGGGEIDLFGNGTIGFRVNGYSELTEENVLNSGGGWNFTNIGGGFIGPMFPAGSVKPKVWYHLAIVHDDTAKTTRIYIDNEMVGEAIDIGVPDVSGGAETWLGKGFARGHGSFRDFRLWDEVRTPAQFDVDITGSEPNLQWYFPLDSVKGISFSDETGNYNGEMKGVIWNK